MTSLSARIVAGEQPRELQEHTLLLVDGSEIRGVLQRTPGTDHPGEHRHQRRLVGRGSHLGTRHLGGLAGYAFEHRVRPGMAG